MSNPFVSVLIITYNQLEFIRETLESAIGQDYDNLEIVVADDCSSDGTTEVVLEYATRYPGRVVPVIGQTNLGITGNSNRGLQACRGKYIAFQGGDDVLLPGKIARQVEWLEADPQRVICYHDMDVFDSASNKTLYLQSEKFRFYAGGAETLVSYGTFFGGTTAMVRYPHDIGIRFNSEIPVASDWLFWIEIAEKQKGFVGYIEGVYARYRRHGNNITSISNHGLKDELTTLAIVERKYPHYSGLCKKRRSLVYLVASYRCFKRRLIIDGIKLALYSLLNCHGNLSIPLSLTTKKSNFDT